MKDSLILLYLLTMTYFALNCGISAVFFFLSLLKPDLDLVRGIYGNNLKIAIII